VGEREEQRTERKNHSEEIRSYSGIDPRSFPKRGSKISLDKLLLLCDQLLQRVQICPKHICIFVFPLSLSQEPGNDVDSSPSRKGEMSL
jgi:hypothetical protein